MQQRAGLVGDGISNGRVRVAERGDREPPEEVEVLVALAVPQLHALAAHERDGEPPVGLHHVLGVERLDLLECTHAPPLSSLRSGPLAPRSAVAPLIRDRSSCRFPRG